MSEENKAIVRRFYEEVWNNGNLAAVDEIFSRDLVAHDPAAPGGSHDREAAKQWFAMVRAAFPDIQFTIEDMIAEGDKVATRTLASATHRGEFMGVPPTNKQATAPELGVWRISAGKVEESWINWDALGWMQQLGVINLPGPGGE